MRFMLLAMTTPWRRLLNIRKSLWIPSPISQKVPILHVSASSCTDNDSSSGEYIMSPLEEGSRNPTQNYGFLINYTPSCDNTRVSSYSVLNHQTKPTADQASVTTSTVKRKSTMILSTMLNNISSVEEKADSDHFVAFKALPNDPARTRRTTGSFDEPASNELFASDCQQAVDVMVDTILQAIQDYDGPNKSVAVLNVPIVSLQDAQRSTTVMAKMEYEFKRLLWLGS